MKVPEPRKLKSGTWFIQMRLGGVSVPVTAATAKECTRQATLIKAEYQSGKRTVQRRQDKTLGEIVDDYIRKVTPVLSPSTIRGYAIIRRNNYQKYMSQSTDSIDYQQMINEETSAYSPKTVKNSWGLIRTAMSDAGLPVPTVKLPAVPVKEIPFLQPEEILPFCEAVRGDIAEIAILLELQGLRRSEATGLDWKDINLERGTINIHGARVMNAEGKFVKKETNKNRTSSRVVPIMIPQLQEALTAVQDKTGRVVTVAENTMLRRAKEACRRAGVTVVGNHGLRHSFASLCYHLGLSVRQLMELGGWADYGTLQKVYVRLSQSAKDAAPLQITSFFCFSK